MMMMMICSKRKTVQKKSRPEVIELHFVSFLRAVCTFYNPLEADHAPGHLLRILHIFFKYFRVFQSIFESFPKYFSEFSKVFLRKYFSEYSNDFFSVFQLFTVCFFKSSRGNLPRIVPLLSDIQSFVILHCPSDQTGYFGLRFITHTIDSKRHFKEHIFHDTFFEVSKNKCGFGSLGEIS